MGTEVERLTANPEVAYSNQTISLRAVFVKCVYLISHDGYLRQNKLHQFIMPQNTQFFIPIQMQIFKRQTYRLMTDITDV